MAGRDDVPGGLKATGGDTDPKKVIPAMSNLTMDGPAGKFTIVPFKNAFIAKRDFFILEVQKVGDVLTWVPVKTYEQVLLGDLSLCGTVDSPVPALVARRLSANDKEPPAASRQGARLVRRRSAGAAETAPRRHLSAPAGCLPG